MKKMNKIKKKVKKNKKSVDSKISKRSNNNEVDLWKEIRSNLKPLSKAYNKFKEKRRIEKQKANERRLRDKEQEKIRNEEQIKLLEQKERKLKKEKRIKEEIDRKLKEQEDQRLEEKRIIDDQKEQVRQEQIYRERLIKGEEERIRQLKRVNELREEESILREKRNIEIMSKLVGKTEKKNPEEKELKLKEEELRLKGEEQRLKEKELKLKEVELRLKDEEQRLKKDENTNIREEKKLVAAEEKKKKRLNGTVLWFNDDKGYGYIKREDNEKDIYVDFSAVENSGLSNLKEAEQLTFEIIHSDKGLSASNLQKIDNEALSPHLKIVK